MKRRGALRDRFGLGAVREFERSTIADLRQRRWLRLHVLLIAAFTTALCWSISAGLRAGGVESLLWRPVLAVALTWPLYLALLAGWARWLISRDDSVLDDGLEPLVDGALDVAGEAAQAAARGAVRVGTRVWGSGAGGHFTGAGAQAAFEPVQAATSLPEGLTDGLGEVGGKAVAGAAEVLGGADEGAVVVVPLIVVVGVAVALATALGFVVFGLFGVDILLGVAVELAFASAGGALAWRAQREGWLSHAMRRTAGPVAGALLALAVAGALLQHWVPGAGTWPQALRMLLASL